MRPDEYDSYTAQRERDTAAALAGSMSDQDALIEARRATERFLPDGLATPRHRLLVAENGSGEVVGHAWLGLDDPRTGAGELAWLYDLRVGEEHRRRGYASAMMRALENLARDAGAQRLGLNVFGDNRAAIALYAGRGYQVTTQQMAKPLS